MVDVGWGIKYDDPLKHLYITHNWRNCNYKHLKMKNLLIGIITLITFSQCGIEEKSESKSVFSNNEVVADTTNEEALVSNDIQLFKITQENNMDAILEMNTPREDEKFTKQGDIKFNFNAVNFPLTNGKHIALWIPTYPIQRVTTADIQTKLRKGNYTSLAFLCDENGMSVKQPEAYALRSFSVKNDNGSNYTDSAMVVINSTAQSTSFNPFIDFYLANTNISKKGNKISLTIDSNVFQLHNWSAYKINGLAKGKHQLKIQLVNHKGEKFKSPYTVDSTEIEIK